MRHITPAVADSWTDAVPGSAARKARIFGRVHWLGRSGRGADARCLRAVLAGEALAGRAFGFALLITRCITYMVTCRTAKKNKWRSEGDQAAVFAVCRAARILISVASATTARAATDRKSTRLNSKHKCATRSPSSACRIQPSDKKN